MIWDNRDLRDRRGMQLSLVQPSANYQFDSRVIFIARLLELAYYGAQQKLYLFQSKPVSILNSWSHIFVRISGVADKPNHSLLEVYLNGAQLISQEAERRYHVLLLIV